MDKEKTDLDGDTWTSWGPANLRKVAFVCAAQARAIKVFPVPGGPYKSTPLGGRIPNFWKRSLWVIGKTMASTNSWICWQKQSYHSLATNSFILKT